MLDFLPMTASRARQIGRPSATDHAAIEREAFRLFAEQGFDETTMEQIADAVGVGRRTLFRYFPSKNDIPWGQFDQSLAEFRRQLDAQPTDLSVADAVNRCIVAFNDFPADAMAQHRTRMELILRTPALQAHSSLRYRAWRAVIASYVAARLELQPTDLVPRLAGHTSLAVAITAYEEWLHPDTTLPLHEILSRSMTALRSYVAPSTPH